MGPGGAGGVHVKQPRRSATDMPPARRSESAGVQHFGDDDDARHRGRRSHGERPRRSATPTSRTSGSSLHTSRVSGSSSGRRSGDGGRRSRGNSSDRGGDDDDDGVLAAAVAAAAMAGDGAAAAEAGGGARERPAAERVQVIEA